MDHHTHFTQLQQLTIFSPSYFIYQFTFSLILAEANRSIMPFLPEKFGFLRR